MKAYGHIRKDKLECAYGCCTFKGGKKLNCREVNDRRARKAARRKAKKIEDFTYDNDNNELVI